MLIPDRATIFWPPGIEMETSLAWLIPVGLAGIIGLAGGGVAPTGGFGVGGMNSGISSSRKSKSSFVRSTKLAVKDKGKIINRG